MIHLCNRLYLNSQPVIHDRVTVFDMMLLNGGEVLLDDIQLTINGQARLSNSSFESGLSSWRKLGNHVQSHTTSDDQQTGAKCLKLIATGHGDPLSLHRRRGGGR